MHYDSLERAWSANRGATINKYIYIYRYIYIYLYIKSLRHCIAAGRKSSFLLKIGHEQALCRRIVVSLRDVLQLILRISKVSRPSNSLFASS